MIAHLETSLAAQASGSVKVIEGMIEPTTVPATALPVLEPPKRKPNRLMMEVDTARSGRRSASRGSACRRPLAPDLTMSGRDKWRFAGIGRGSARRARFDRRRAYTPFSNGQLRLPSRSRPINRGWQSAGIFPHRDAKLSAPLRPQHWCGRCAPVGGLLDSGKRISKELRRRPFTSAPPGRGTFFGFKFSSRRHPRKRV